MRVEVHSPEGLEAATVDRFEAIAKDGDTWLIATENEYGLVFLDAVEMARVVSAVERASA